MLPLCRRKAVWPLLLLALLVMAHNACASPAVWDELLAEYRTCGLPFPPPEAAPVLVVAYKTQLSGGKYQSVNCLGFQLRPAVEKSRALVLVGTEECEPDSFHSMAAADPATIAGDELGISWAEQPFEVNAGLAAAIQCKLRGWGRLAELLLAKSRGESVGHQFSQFRQPMGDAPRLAVARLAMSHWANVLLKANTDRARIAAQMTELFDRVPSVRSPEHDALLKSLKLALAPSTAVPGTPEAWIDDLVDLTYHVPSGRDEPDPRLLRLVLAGFHAVPALIQHLHDERLTRTIKTGFNDLSAYHQRLGMVATDILLQISGVHLETNSLEGVLGSYGDKKAAEKWWMAAQALGEEAYMAKHVWPEVPKHAWPNDGPLRILTLRYPTQLPAIYRTILRKRAYMQSWPLTEAIAKSGLPSAQKIALYKEGATHPNLEHRRMALYQLRELDAPYFLNVLVKTLEQIPRTPAQAYWLCPEGALSHLVMETEDQHAWYVLLRVAKRSDVGLRMELMNPMNYSYIAGRVRRRRLGYLAAFLDDPAVPDTRRNPRMWGGPWAGFDMPGISVRNLAAMKCGSILELEPTPEAEWTETQWADYRSQVRDALHRELAVAR